MIYIARLRPQGGAISVTADSGLVTIWDLSSLNALQPRGQIEWGGEKMRPLFPPSVDEAKEILSNYVVKRVVDVTFNQPGDRFSCLGPNSRIQVRRWSDLFLEQEFGDKGKYSAISFNSTGNILIADGFHYADTKVIYGNGYQASGTSRFQIDAFDVLNGQSIASSTNGAWGGLSSCSAHDIVASIANDQPGTEIRFFDVRNGLKQCPFVLTSEANAEGVTFSPDGTLISIFGEDQDCFTCAVLEFPSFHQRFASIHSTKQGHRRLFRLRRQAVFSGQGDRLFYPLPDGEIVEIDSSTGGELGRWKVHNEAVTAFSGDVDRGLLLTGSENGEMKLWRAALGTSPRLSLASAFEWNTSSNQKTETFGVDWTHFSDL